MGCKEKYIPCGIVDEDSAALNITFGSSYKTSDFIVDTIEAKWNAMAEQEKAKTSLIQIKMDNGPESSGRRTQFLSRMVQFADVINRPIHLLYYPPYHSKYNPIERCWGILELNGMERNCSHSIGFSGGEVQACTDSPPKSGFVG